MLEFGFFVFGVRTLFRFLLLFEVDFFGVPRFGVYCWVMVEGCLLLLLCGG